MCLSSESVSSSPLYNASIYNTFWAIATSLEKLHIEILSIQQSYKKTLKISFDIIKMFSVQFWVHVLFYPLMELPPIESSFPIFAAILNKFNIELFYMFKCDLGPDTFYVPWTYMGGFSINGQVKPCTQHWTMTI